METDPQASPLETPGRAPAAGNARPPLVRVLMLLAATLALAVTLAEIYAAVAPLTGGVGWAAAFAVHAAFAGVALSFREKRALMRPAAPRFFLPALAIVAGTLALVAAGHLFGGATSRGVGREQLVWVLFVPWVEELVFRAGIGDAFRRLGGPLWGSWFSAIVFALVHGQPTLANMMALKVGLPLGPFLLALCGEALYVKSGKLLPAVAFHAACNATVVLFAYGDARWLDWLGLLYS